MARRRFFVDEIRAGVAEIKGEDALHLTRVLRVEKGQRFEISDQDSVWLAEVTEARKSLVEFHVIEPLESGPAPPVVHLFASLFKFDRFEWMVEKVTELGVSRIVPVEAERTDNGLFAAAAKRAERWRRIAREASQQSRRVRAPLVDEPVKLRRLQVEGLRLLLDELPGAPLLQVPAGWTGADPLNLFIGPEGGWTADERDYLVGSGCQPASLGRTILRAETAAISALSIIMHALPIH